MSCLLRNRQVCKAVTVPVIYEIAKRLEVIE